MYTKDDNTIPDDCMAEDWYNLGWSEAIFGQTFDVPNNGYSLDYCCGWMDAKESERVDEE